MYPTIKIKVQTEYAKDLQKEVNKKLGTNFKTEDLQGYSNVFNEDDTWFFEFKAVLLPVKDYKLLKAKAKNWDFIIEQVKDKL